MIDEDEDVEDEEWDEEEDFEEEEWQKSLKHTEHSCVLSLLEIFWRFFL